MATIKSPWVGAASGRLGESTYYRKNGKTLARALPSTVSNPRTKAQMLQRIVFAVVAQAASQMKNVVNHSFEAKKYGEESLNYFRSRALADMRAKAINAVNAPTPEDELVHGCFTRKGIATLPTNDYLISEGSLQPFNTMTIMEGGEVRTHAIQLASPLVCTPDDNDLTFSDKDLLAALGLSIGQQASFACIEIGAYAYENETDSMSQRFGNFRIFRLRSNPDQGNEESALKATLDEDTGQYVLHVESTANIIVENEFDLVFYKEANENNLYACIAMTTGEMKNFAVDLFAEGRFGACCTCVRSEYSATSGKWLRSTQRLSYDGGILGLITGTSYTSAWQSWQKAEAQLLTTDRLLNYEGLNP
jgi:hypothetical protein